MTVSFYLCFSAEIHGGSTKKNDMIWINVYINQLPVCGCG